MDIQSRYFSGNGESFPDVYANAIYISLSNLDTEVGLSGKKSLF